MSSANRENTITGRVANYLRGHDILAETFKSQQMPGRTHPVEPDFTIENGGIFFGEAKWEDDYFEAIAEARDYGLIPSNGTFAIGYPEELKQRRLTEYTEEESLSGHQYRVAGMRPDRETEMTSLSIEEFPEWLRDQVYENTEPSTDPEEAIALLRQIATAFTREFDNVETPDLFRNVLGVTPSESEQEKAAKRAAGYLLIDQIAFYRVLSSAGKYREIEPERLTSPSDLQAYFNDVLDDNYAAIFSFPVAEAYPQEALPLLRRGIKSIYGLAPDQISHEVLGTVFHSLTPAAVRKPLGAYYTKNEPAELLAELSVNEADNTIFDPSCGSGTLLTAAYRRKRELHSDFTETEHRKFVEEDITGIDIMPFAAHLSTIHLALEQPIYQTDEVRIGIDDATKLSPGVSIPPLSYVLPEALLGQKSIGDYTGDMDWREETVEQGSVTADGIGTASIDLQKADVIIMNPPFSRQESVAQFSDTYKQKLKERFSERKNQLHGKMSYCSYFLFLADKFLDDGGTIAAILPASTLNKQSDEGVRKMILNEYNLDYIIAREDKSNFSEDTAFREILLIARKGQTNESDTAYLSLNGLNVNSSDVIDTVGTLSERKTNDGSEHTAEYSREEFTARLFPTSKLNPDNLFSPFAVNNQELFDLWYRFAASDSLSLIQDMDTGLTGGSGGGIPYWNEGVLNSPHDYLRDDDVWVVDKETDGTVHARHKHVGETVGVPLTALEPYFHRYANRGGMDVTDLSEYTAVDDFDEIQRFLQLAERDEIPDGWNGHVERRKAHLSIPDRFDFTAPGTRHAAYYSGTRRMFHRMWMFPDLDKEESKCLATYFNSTVGFLQFLIKRIPYRGGWGKYHRHTIAKFSAPNPARLSSEAERMLLDAFDEVHTREFPKLSEQLARCTAHENLHSEEKAYLSELFTDIEPIIGTGFEPRLTMDRAVLNALGLPEDEWEPLLERLYPALLNELVALKQLMK